MPLAWIVPLLRLRESEVLRVTGGLDVVMYLRVVRFGELLDYMSSVAAAAAAAAVSDLSGQR
jgi:hypothetical protein